MLLLMLYRDQYERTFHRVMVYNFELGYMKMTIHIIMVHLCLLETCGN